MTSPRGGEIKLVQLTKRYGSELVVAGIDLSVAAGEFVSLLGPSGSGKTTTLMMIAGFLEPDSGTVTIAGTDVTRQPPQRRGLGMVFQNYALFPHLSVFENVAFPLRIRGRPAAEIVKSVRETLLMVGLEAFESRHPRELSGGQQQRVALARAVVFRPAIVLMDEPLGALDKNLRFRMQTEIQDIQRRLGMTIVYVTHDQEEAMNMSDRIAIMDRGRLLQAGPPRDIYERPATPFAARFLGEANLIAGRRDGDGFRTRGGRLLTGARAADPDPDWLFVRPEKLRLGPPGIDNGSAESALGGTVARRSFLGTVFRYAIDAGEAEPIVVDVPNDGAGPAAEVGQAVSVSWRPDAGTLLGRDPA